MPTYCHIDSTDVIENDYNTQKVVGRKQNKKDYADIFNTSFEKIQI
jgi:hypothetical protein